MKLIVMYDIRSDRVRELVASKLERLGLTRVQRSVFIGWGNAQKVKDIERVVSRLIDRGTDVVHIVPIDEAYWRRVRVLGTPYNVRRSVGVASIV